MLTGGQEKLEGQKKGRYRYSPIKKGIIQIIPLNTSPRHLGVFQKSRVHTENNLFIDKLQIVKSHHNKRMYQHEIK